MPYKNFPPGWQHVWIPLSSRQAALAGLTLYTPCRRRGWWAQEVASWGVRLFGPRVLPGRSQEWFPTALGADLWEGLSSVWRKELGNFDEIAAYHRVDARSGMALLLLRRGTPLAFVKLRKERGECLRREAEVLRLVWEYRPQAFVVPQPLSAGEVGGCWYFAMSALPARPHRPPRDPPLDHVLCEVELALQGLERPPGTPSHWRPTHGDFTPWNLRELDSRLYLVDWENAGWGPLHADLVLYTAVGAALGLSRPRPSAAKEAIRHWQECIASRRPTTAREERLRSGTLEALAKMWAAGGSTAAFARDPSRGDVLPSSHQRAPE